MSYENLFGNTWTGKALQPFYLYIGQTFTGACNSSRNLDMLCSEWLCVLILTKTIHCFFSVHYYKTFWNSSCFSGNGRESRLLFGNKWELDWEWEWSRGNGMEWIHKSHSCTSLMLTIKISDHPKSCLVCSSSDRSLPDNHNSRALSTAIFTTWQSQFTLCMFSSLTFKFCRQSLLSTGSTWYQSRRPTSARWW